MSFCRPIAVALLGLLSSLASPASMAQDLYDTAVLRNVALNFHDADWEALLRANYESQAYILADMEIDGEVYPDVGVRIRGNTSYTALPQGSDKFSLKIKTDFTDPDQAVMGIDTLNLNNGFRDPTFSREVAYNNFVARFIPNPRANHVTVTLNGENWGVYINVQQPDKAMLRSYFTDEDGLRINCANIPFGPGLRYMGENPVSYGMYEIQDDGGLPDPVGALIDVSDALSNAPLDMWWTIDSLFAIDPSIWSVVLENLLTDDDSYINKGCDFMTYRDPIDGRMHLLQRDANETFTQSTWSITRNFDQTNKPVLSRVLSVPELRQRYMAHYRTASKDLDWDYFGPVFAAHRALIDAAVQADTRKLYSYALFQANFTTTVNMPLGGLAGGNIVGLQQFVDQRSAFLDGSAELSASAPTFGAVEASDDAPVAGDPVWVTAQVDGNGGGVASVELFYRPSAAELYSRVPMLDDGQSGDGAAGDGVHGAQLPVDGLPAQRVAWYVAAVADNSFLSRSFAPAGAERDPLSIEFQLGNMPGMKVTEWMYAGTDGEFVEYTNTSDQPIDMTGWSMDDSNNLPGAFDLSAFGLVAPGESVIVTESVAADFRASWGLGDDVKVIGELGVVTGNNFGRNDQINLYDDGGVLHDRLSYGDETFPGSIRTQNASGQTGCAAIGADDVVAWQLSAVGDLYGSFASLGADVGTPGSYGAVGCVADTIFVDGFEP